MCTMSQNLCTGSQEGNCLPCDLFPGDICMFVLAYSFVLPFLLQRFCRFRCRLECKSKYQSGLKCGLESKSHSKSKFELESKSENPKSKFECGSTSNSDFLIETELLI